MKDIFVDLLLEGHSPEDLAAAMTEALHEVETVKAQIARDEALSRCVDAMNEYFGLVDPDWEPVNEGEVEAIANMVVGTRSVVNDILDMFNTTPAVNIIPAQPDPAPAPKCECGKDKETCDCEDDVFAAIFDFLNELGL